MITIRNPSNQPLAVVERYHNDIIDETINGEYKFSFSTLIDEDGKSDYLIDGNLVEVDDQLFNIVHHRRTRAGDGSTLVAIECEQVSYDLLTYEWADGFVHAGTPEQLLNMALAGTGFTIGVVELSGIISVDLAEENISTRAILLEIAAQSGGELRFDRYSISLLQQRGTLRGVWFQLGKNLKGIVKDIDTRSGERVTAYEVDVLELNSLPEFRGMEYFELGDTVGIVDPELSINEQQRIVRYSYSPRRRINSKVTISNAITGIKDAVVGLRKTTIVKDKIYNGTRIGPEVGFESIRSDKMARTVMNATEGIKIQKGNGTGSSWIDVIFLDTDGNALFTGKIEASSFVGGNIYGSNIVGGSIKSDTDIDITRDARIGANLYMGIVGALGDRKIEFVDSDIYSAFISFTETSKEMMLRGSNDVRISAGESLFFTGGNIMFMPAGGQAYVGADISSGNRIVTESDLEPVYTELDNVNSLASDARYSSGVNLSYDPVTKNLKMYNAFGTQIAMVNLS
ncbi:prophage endopeptidase tail family protein [Paenibacillus sp. FSL H7-0735]|uniref:prophage endopeptidase tail family protein n=1 Tax=Paenibacillus sp. FSL H7-0735 TaxID=2954736 RepID=UPI0030F7FF3A